MEWAEYINSLHLVRAVVAPAKHEVGEALPLDVMTPEAEVELSNGAGDDDEQ